MNPTPTKFSCYIYEVGKCRKDLHLSINLEEFDPSKLTLTVAKLNEENFKILYDGKKFHLHLENLYAKVKSSRVFEQEYLSIKDDCTKAKKCLYEVFFAIKELIASNINEEICSFIDWNKIWLNCTEYDLTQKHSYHLENLYIALDGVICFRDPYVKSYKLDCEMIDSFIYLCKKCDTFLF